MSILDDFDKLEIASDEAVMRWYQDQESWTKFQKEIVEPHVKKLMKGKPMRNFSVGIHVPCDYRIGIGQSLSSLCLANNIDFYHLDCRTVSSYNTAIGYLTTICTHPNSVILIENFDEILDLPEKKYLENILIKIWERDFVLPRKDYFVVFATSNNYNSRIPGLLKNIKSLDWYGSIRK